MVDFSCPRPATDVPLVVMPDNASLHRSADLRPALPDLRTPNVCPCYLAPYAPELNAIAPVFRAVKHLDLPERRYRSTADLETAAAGFGRRVGPQRAGDDADPARGPR